MEGENDDVPCFHRIIPRPLCLGHVISSATHKNNVYESGDGWGMEGGRVCVFCCLLFLILKVVVGVFHDEVGGGDL